MDRDWKDDFGKYEKFLKGIDVQNYAVLRAIKTVEQDLPRELLPLELYYKHYWETTNFKSYEDIFKAYWSEKLNPHIYEFIKKYFYGCSLRFVEDGFKARLYRIWMSILTQFHFQYLWNTLFELKLDSNAELDAAGIDAVAQIDGKKVGVQVKKVSYRREVSDRRFTRRQENYADVIVEVPYLVVDLKELEEKIKNPRAREDTKKKCRSALKAFNKNFVRFDNGFVVFREEYLKNIFKKIREKTAQRKKGKITYEEILSW